MDGRKGLDSKEAGRHSGLAISGDTRGFQKGRINGIKGVQLLVCTCSFPNMSCMFRN